VAHGLLLSMFTKLRCDKLPLVCRLHNTSLVSFVSSSAVFMSGAAVQSQMVDGIRPQKTGLLPDEVNGGSLISQLCPT